MPVINICFLCPHHVSPHLNSADDNVEKITKKKYRSKKSRGANRQQPVWMIASLEERQVHFSQVPFTAFTLRTVFYISIFIYRVAVALCQIDIHQMRIYAVRFLTVLFIFSYFVIVNTKVDVFNLEMNVIGEFRVVFNDAAWVPMFTHCSYILSVSMWTIVSWFIINFNFGGYFSFVLRIN